jgi:hypothetical protein
MKDKIRSFRQSAVLRVCPRLGFLAISSAPTRTEMLGFVPRPYLLLLLSIGKYSFIIGKYN